MDVGREWRAAADGRRRCGNHFDAGTADLGAAAADWIDPDLDWQDFLQAVDVRDQADELAGVLLQMGKGVERLLQRVGVEGAEAFVEEEAAELDFAAGHVGESEGEGEGDEEGFAAGEVGDGTDGVAVMGVDDPDKLVFAAELVARAQSQQMLVGEAEQAFQGETLGEALEAVLAVDAALGQVPGSEFVGGGLALRQQVAVAAAGELVGAEFLLVGAELLTLFVEDDFDRFKSAGQHFGAGLRPGL